MDELADCTRVYCLLVLIGIDFANNLEDSSDGLEVDFIGTADFETPDSLSGALSSRDFACLSPEDIVREQNVQIARISDLLHIPPSNASNLLRSYQARSIFPALSVSHELVEN